MTWTNRFNLPKPLALLIQEDVYHTKRQQQLEDYCKEAGLDPKKVKHFSVSDLIKPPRMRVLAQRHALEMVKDVSQEIFRLLGQAIHWTLREVAIQGALDKQGYKAEERMFSHLTVDGQVVVVSGEPDIVGPDMCLQDYKVVAVYSWQKGAKAEWEQQTNAYAWLRALRGLVTTKLEICYVLRDFNVNETVQEGYPPAGAQVEDLPLWTFEKQQAWVLERVRLHLGAETAFDDELPECTEEEMWARLDSWAVIRQGLKRAAKVFTAEFHVKAGVDREQAKILAHGEAEADAQKRNQSPKIVSGKEKPYDVEHRAGERPRCLRFCDAKQWCSQFKEYASTFKANESRDPVEAAE